MDGALAGIEHFGKLLNDNSKFWRRIALLTVLLTYLVFFGEVLCRAMCPQGG